MKMMIKSLKMTKKIMRKMTKKMIIRKMRTTTEHLNVFLLPVRRTKEFEEAVNVNTVA